ncbi:MAG: lysophospholipid acyltransferase family protein [Candidatus Eremiobacterota bacterium]
MLDLARLRRTRLYTTPFSHKFMAHTFLYLTYRFPRRTEIVLEGLENLPRDRTVMLAMNHSDMYNYWPLQYRLYFHGGFPYVSVWVKGKYYHHPLVAFFLDSTNNIPIPSRGYVISTDFFRRFRRKPTEEEYRALRLAVDQADAKALPPVVDDPQRYLRQFEDTWDSLVQEVARLNHRALRELGLNVLVFPQGTRSRRLSQGHTGLAQMAMHLRAAIVPIACNGSDHVYPTTMPFAQGGRIVYRIGAPLEPDGPELGPLQIAEPFLPLSRAAVERHSDRFRRVTDLVMDRINDMLDPEYRYTEDRRSEGVQGVDRFL